MKTRLYVVSPNMWGFVKMKMLHPHVGRSTRGWVCGVRMLPHKGRALLFCMLQRKQLFVLEMYG